MIGHEDIIITAVVFQMHAGDNCRHRYRLRGLAAWRSGIRRMNEVNARRARLVSGWVTVFGRVYHLAL